MAPKTRRGHRGLSRKYAGSRALTCRFGDPRKENCDMMCRPLRAVMVGHRYAIIVPEVRGIRCAPRSRRSHFAEIRHTCALFFSLSPLPFSHQRAGDERSRGGARTLSVACPATPAGCYSRRRHSRTPGRRDWPPSCTRTGRNRWRSAAGICTRTVSHAETSRGAKAAE